jgi:hypothetical protein
MEPQPLSRDEVKKLLLACRNTTVGIRDRAVLTLLYRGYMRIAATLEIRPTDIDWDRNLVTVHSDKGGKGRTVPIDDGAMNVIRLWAERRTKLGINGHHPFFCATDKDCLGNALNSSHFRRKIKTLQAKAGIEKRCHLHVLRHTGASELLEEGFDIATIAAVLGHDNISTTSQYLHRLRPDVMDEKLKARVWSDLETVKFEKPPMTESAALSELKQHLTELGQKFNEANEAHAANYTALLIALMNKGLITLEDYEFARTKAMHLAEQEFARKRDEIQKENETP